MSVTLSNKNSGIGTASCGVTKLTNLSYECSVALQCRASSAEQFSARQRSSMQGSPVQFKAVPYHSNALARMFLPKLAHPRCCLWLMHK